MTHGSPSSIVPSLEDFLPVPPAFLSPPLRPATDRGANQQCVRAQASPAFGCIILTSETRPPQMAGGGFDWPQPVVSGQARDLPTPGYTQLLPGRRSGYKATEEHFGKPLKSALENGRFLKSRNCI